MAGDTKTQAQVRYEVVDRVGKGATKVKFVATGHRPRGIGFILPEGTGEEELATAERRAIRLPIQGEHDHIVGPWRTGESRLRAVAQEGTVNDIGKSLARALEEEVGQPVRWVYGPNPDPEVATGEEMASRSTKLNLP